MFGLGFGELIVILIVALLLFGPEKLPEVARTMGKAVAELRRAMDEFRHEVSTPRFEVERELRDLSIKPNSTQSALNAAVQNVSDEAPAAVADPKNSETGTT